MDNCAFNLGSLPKKIIGIGLGFNDKLTFKYGDVGIKCLQTYSHLFRKAIKVREAIGY